MIEQDAILQAFLVCSAEQYTRQQLYNLSPDGGRLLCFIMEEI